MQVDCCHVDAQGIGGTHVKGGYPMFNYLRQALHNEEGADLAEYALVLMLISIAAMGIMTTLGTQIADVFCQIVTTLGGSC